MTDQVQRSLVDDLRGRMIATKWKRGLDLDYATSWEPDALCQHAADEIQALREMLRKALEALEYCAEDSAELLVERKYKWGVYRKDWQEEMAAALARHFLLIDEIRKMTS